MTSSVPEPPALSPSGDPEADARFADYLALVAADVDDPVWGEDCRAILSDDPEQQRALFDLAEAMATRPVTAAPLSMLVTSVTALAALASFAVYILRVLV